MQRGAELYNNYKEINFEIFENIVKRTRILVIERCELRI